MSILNDIYNNAYEPLPNRPKAEYASLREEIYGLWSQIETTMGSELTERLWDKETELLSLEREEVFRAGFRLGAGLMAELL